MIVWILIITPSIKVGHFERNLPGIERFSKKLIFSSKGVQTAQLVGQGYDGAGNMYGKRKGVQARIQQQIPNAV
jgi:hypothetical protein